MQNNWNNIDFKNMVETLWENVRSFGGFNPEEVHQAGFQTENYLRSAILTALLEGPKTGHEIIETLATQNSTAPKPSAASVYPLLESLRDEELIATKMNKDRKTYLLTEAGKASQENTVFQSPAEPDIAGSAFGATKWVDLRGAVPIALSRLAKVSIEVAKFGTKEQQDEAALAVDEARRKIHEILATK